MLGSFRDITLTRRLFILTAIALVPALAIVFYNLVSSHRERERDVHDLARRTSQLASLEIERIVSGARGSFGHWHGHPRRRGSTPFPAASISPT